jgi:antitoxin ParD1/3/4
MTAASDKISIALPNEMVRLIHAAVDSGDYASSSEVVRDALREWSHKRALRQEGVAELRQFWQAARDKKFKGVPAKSVLDRLEQKFVARAAGSRKRA